ncbi:unnamed protein product [Rotaria sordida]|uniref:Tetratricopeptide repeat protein n=1 Tax=Rotaria sordida TaxID=392033 RepID=A0A814RWV4_9BILA|nr:unnamed protein product [Rotaria sordida]CAF1369142.1 unnamed protein product [Rotaria sordida]
MGFLMRDVDRQIEQVYSISNNEQSLILYRGQGMSNVDFEKLKNSNGGLLSFNNFLSTSTNRQVSLRFALKARNNPDLNPVLFQIKIDPSIESVPFAALDSISYYKLSEKEILFSMHTVFRIGEIKPIENNLWQVELKLTNEDDPQLKILTDYLRQEIRGEKGWNRLAQLLEKMGQLDKAEEIYKNLLSTTSEDDLPRLGSLNGHLGHINELKGNLSSALSFFKKSLAIVEKICPRNLRDLAINYSNIGGIYRAMDDASNAFLFYKKARRIFESIPSSDRLSLAAIYNNFGGLYQQTRDYSLALLFFQKALQIEEESLPSNHSSLATTYNNIGLAYKYMGDNKNALLFYQKALEIREKYLPPDHQDIGMIYNNIAGVYFSMRDYSRTLSFLQKARPILEASLPANHPYLIGINKHITLTYLLLGDHSNA